MFSGGWRNFKVDSMTWIYLNPSALDTTFIWNAKLDLCDNFLLSKRLLGIIARISFDYHMPVLP